MQSTKMSVLVTVSLASLLSLADSLSDPCEVMSEYISQDGFCNGEAEWPLWVLFFPGGETVDPGLPCL